MTTAANMQYPPGFLEEFNGGSLIGAAIAFLALEILVVAARYITRYMTGVESGWDDWMIIPSLLSAVSVCGISFAMINAGGMGYHEAAVELQDPAKLTTFTKLQIPFTFAYFLGVTFPKLAILCLYLRIFPKKTYRNFCYVLAGVVVASTVANLITTCVVCTPLSDLWDPPKTEPHCIDIYAFWRFSTIPNIITDVVMLVLPVPVIWKIQLSKKDRIGILATFAFGGIGLITSVIRFVGFTNINGTTDTTWADTDLAIYSIAETGVYLIAACLPTLRPLFMYIRKHHITSHGASNGSQGHSRGYQLQQPSKKQSLGCQAEAAIRLDNFDDDVSALVHKPSLAEQTDLEGQIHVRSDYMVTRNYH